jgi:hypothetical protein
VQAGARDSCRYMGGMASDRPQAGHNAGWGRVKRGPRDWLCNQAQAGVDRRSGGRCPGSGDAPHRVVWRQRHVGLMQRERARQARPIAVHGRRLPHGQKLARSFGPLAILCSANGNAWLDIEQPPFQKRKGAGPTPAQARSRALGSCSARLPPACRQRQGMPHT